MSAVWRNHPKSSPTDLLAQQTVDSAIAVPNFNEMLINFKTLELIGLLFYSIGATVIQATAGV